MRDRPTPDGPQTRGIRCNAVDDRGIAMAATLMIGSVLVLLSSIMVLRSMRQIDQTASDIDFEQALHVAESALADGLDRVDVDPTYDTGETSPSSFADNDVERLWAVAVAGGASISRVMAGPEGEYVVVKPANAEVIYAVGFAPSRAAIGRRTRVVRAILDTVRGVVSFEATISFLTEGDLSITGNPTFHGGSASVHANGSVDVSGNPRLHDGCLTSSDGATVTGNINEPSSCPADSWDQPEKEVPAVDPRDFWHLAEYDLCPGGEVRAGPSHATLGGTAGSAPCTTGLVLDADASSPYLGWRFTGCCDSGEWATWEYDSNVANDGAFYAYQGTVRVTSGPGTNNNPWNVLIAAEARAVCPNLAGGDVFLPGSMVMAPYTAGTAHAGNQHVIVAGRDVDWTGNGRLKIPGIVAAHEQIRIDLNPQVEGSFIAEDACESVLDSVDANEISGQPTFELEGPVDTFWDSVILEDFLYVAGWDEL